MELSDRTLAWWERLLADEAAMNRWLIKLHGTEIGGYHDNLSFNMRFNDGRCDNLAGRIFSDTGRDEKKHAFILEELLAERGLGTLQDVDTPSIYWDTMYTALEDIKSAAAILYHGEKLAADRFHIIAEHNGTPADIKYFLDIALPEEQFHAAAFKALAGSDAIEQIAELQTHALNWTLGIK